MHPVHQNQSVRRFTPDFAAVNNQIQWSDRPSGLQVNKLKRFFKACPNWLFNCSEVERRGSQVEKAEVLQNFVRLFDSAPRLQVRNVVDLTFNGAFL